MAEVGRYDFEIRQGGTFTRTITWTDNSTPGVPIDITGYTIRSQIRQTLTDTSFLLEMSTGVDARIAITDAVNGVFTITVSATDTAALDFGTAIYDLEMVSPGGVVTPLLEGVVTLVREVTR